VIVVGVFFVPKCVSYSNVAAEAVKVSGVGVFSGEGETEAEIKAKGIKDCRRRSGGLILAEVVYFEVPRFGVKCSSA
jgi:hypothetical protein